MRKNYIFCYILSSRSYYGKLNTNNLNQTIVSALGSLGGGALNVVLVAVGNVMVILSTFFLNGPQKQIESMKAPERLVITILYLASLAFSIVVLIIDSDNKVLVFLSLACILVMMVLYQLSYFPGVRQWVRNLCCRSDGSGASTPMNQ